MDRKEESEWVLLKGMEVKLNPPKAGACIELNPVVFSIFFRYQ
jgi:hypothetical protein